MPFLAPYVEDSLRQKAQANQVVNQWLAVPPYKVRLTIDDLPQELRQRMTKLEPHQRKGALTFGQRRAGILADEPGLGKTATAITATDIANGHEPCFPVLVITHLSTLDNWAREIGMWSGRKGVVIRSKADWKKVSAMFDSGFDLDRPDYFICGYDGATSNMTRIRTIPWRGMILDEAHLIKDRTTKRYKGIRDLINNAANDNRPLLTLRLCMTGTPYMNRPEDYLALLNFTGDMPFFGSVAQYERVFGKDRITKELEQSLNKILLQAGIMVRHTNDEGAIPLYRVPVPISLTDSGMEEYKFELTRIMDAMLEGADQPTLSQHLEHLIMAAGIAKAPGVALWAESRAMADISTVIFYRHQRVGDMLENALDKFGLVRLDGKTPPKDRDTLIQAFQRGEAKVFLAQITAAGVGITLTQATQCAFAQYPWNAATTDQCEKRIHRIGQDKPCTAYWLVAQDTVEEHIVDLINGKRASSSRIVDGIEAPDQSVAQSLLSIIASQPTKKEKSGVKD
jgi:SNF2 family DNA or RNA helicase